MKTKSGITVPNDIAPFIAGDAERRRSPLREIFRQASGALLGDPAVRLSPEQRRLVVDMSRCRTIECGFNLEACRECGCRRIHYNSCGNRNCSICNALKTELWVDARSSEVIDAAYYHAVFTCPHELNPLFLANRKAMFSLLHRSVGAAIVELSRDEKYLGATPGVIQVLHTWNQRLAFHPHIHAVISGGGLTGDRRLKVLEGAPFFIPESVIAALFRGKFLAGLEDLRRSGGINFPPGQDHLKNPDDWAAFRDALYGRRWVAHVKETFNGKGNAIEYLGRYANKVAITGSRIVSVSEDEVVFTVRGKDGRQSEVESLTPLDFTRRYLLHVLPPGFQKVRYYGYLANGVRKKNMVHIFNLQGFRQYLSKYEGMNAKQVIFAKWNHDVDACPHCGAKSRFFPLYASGRPRKDSGG